MMKKATNFLIVLFFLSACGPLVDWDAQPGKSRKDEGIGGLYQGFMGQGKYDSAGHPVGAIVVQAETDCYPSTGVRQAEGWGVDPNEHGAGLICGRRIQDIGGGAYSINVRALVPEVVPDHCFGTTTPSYDCQTAVPVLTVRVFDDKLREIASRTITADFFEEPFVYQNILLTFNHEGLKSITVEVIWSGTYPVRIDYMEFFWAKTYVTINPASGIWNPEEFLRFEEINVLGGTDTRVFCGDTDLTNTLNELLSMNRAVKESTESLTVITTPAESLLQLCELPSRIKVEAHDGYFPLATSRVTYLKEEPLCTFSNGTTKVLLTGFEPFPADASSDNSSEQAVLNYDGAGIEGVSFMRMVLPVEWDTAAQMVSSIIDRCHPDVVVAFGQGRWGKVDLETTAYNNKDSSDLHGGAYDNRGVVYAGHPIEENGPRTHEATLPTNLIVEELKRNGVDVSQSEDAGRFICNNVFYSLMHKAQSTGLTAGFVHLPVMQHVGDAQLSELQTIVDTVVRQSLISLE